MNAKVPVLGTLNEAVAMTVNHRRDLLRVGLVFIIGFFALSIVFARYLWPLFSEAMMDSPATGTPAADGSAPAIGHAAHVSSSKSCCSPSLRSAGIVPC